jgi:hypothetical protein
MRKISRKGIINKLDKLISVQIRARGMCERCGKKENLQCAHIYSRSYKHLRWEPENLICLCSGCHFWWHQNPAEAIIWVMDIRDIKKLKKIRQNTTPIKDWQLQAMLDEMKEEDDFIKHDLDMSNEGTQ